MRHLSVIVSLFTRGLLFAVLVVCASMVGAQPPNPGVVGPTFGQAIRHDVSPPLSLIATRSPVDLEGESLEMPLLRRPRTYPPNISHGPDLLRQTEARPVADAALTPTPSMNFEGLSNIDGVLPPDTNGDVGIDYYVQWVNLSFAVFDKATGLIVPNGGPFDGNSLWNGFGGPCETNNDGDPIALYDHLADRWLMSQFSISEGIQCMAVSITSDPLGSYHRWAFVVSPGQQNDYPKIGLMPDSYYLTVRDFPSGSNNFAGFVAFDRSAMVAGDAAPTFIKFGLPCATDNCVDGVQPPHLEGPAPPAGTPGYFTKTWDDDNEGPWGGAGGSDGYRIWEFLPDFTTPPNSTFVELPIIPAGADFDTNLCGGSRACIPEPDEPPACQLNPRDGSELTDCDRLDGFADLQMYRAQFRHWNTYNTIVISNGVDVDGNDTSGVRWAELRDTGPGGSWIVHQDGTYSPADGEHRWMSSIAMDSDGNIALGYSVSSRNTHPSVRYVSREAGDPLGVLPGGEVELIAGSGTQQSESHRWGDYSSMSVDPTDDCTFWYTQEYIQTTGSAPWRTRIGSFRIPTCTVAAISTNPESHNFAATEVSSSAAALTVTINNDATDPINITDVALSNTTDFALDTNPAGDPCGGISFMLPGSDSCDVEVTFSPQSQAVFSETLEVTTDVTGVSGAVSLSGTGYTACPHNDTETLTGSGSGTVTVSACQTVTIGPYDFTGGTLEVTAGEAIEVLNGTTLANAVELINDPFLALP